jgi:hypothetical protein
MNSTAPLFGTPNKLRLAVGVPAFANEALGGLGPQVDRQLQPESVGWRCGEGQCTPRS